MNHLCDGRRLSQCSSMKDDGDSISGVPRIPGQPLPRSHIRQNVGERSPAHVLDERGYSSMEDVG